jgi:hypothetical protein
MKNSKIILMCVLLISLGLLSSCKKVNSYTMSGDYMVYNTAQEIVDSSDLVFSGNVISVRYEMLDVRTESGVDSMTGLEKTEPLPYTLYEIEIIETYKGSYNSNTIILKRPGGVFEDATYELENSTEILVDEQYLFLATEFANSYPSLQNATQASYNLNAPSTASYDNEITLSEILEVFEN